MADKRCVALFVPLFPADESDSTCIPALQEYVRALGRATDLEPVVIAFQYPAPARRYRWHGIEVLAAGGRNRRGVLRRLTWLRVAAAFWSLRRRMAVAAVHSFWLGECTLVAQRLAGHLGVRHVASIMGQDAAAVYTYLGRIDLERLVLTCGSNFAAQHFDKAAGRRVEHIIPFGLDVERFRRGPRHRDFDIVGIGSLIELKNYGLFVRLVDELRSEFPSLKAALIGDGPERESLEREILRRGLGEHLVLMGEQPRGTVIEQLSRSRVLLHPSRYEGQGYVFLEALQAGLSVVSFDVGYRPPTRRAHACRDVDEMRDVLRSLLHEPPVEDVVNVETIDQTVASFRNLYGL